MRFTRWPTTNEALTLLFRSSGWMRWSAAKTDFRRDRFITGLLTPPQRIGLSATQNPIELVAEFSHRDRPRSKARNDRASGTEDASMDVAIEVPSDELTSVTSHAMWEEIFDKLASIHGEPSIDAGLREHPAAC